MGDSHTVGPCKKAVFACLAADESYLTLQRGGIFPVFRKREKRERLSRPLTMSAKQLIISQSTANVVDRT